MPQASAQSHRNLTRLAVEQLVIGPISDRTGRRRPLLVGALACVLASVLCALAPTIGTLVAQFVQGFAGETARRDATRRNHEEPQRRR
jgi:MFS family permease